MATKGLETRVPDDISTTIDDWDEKLEAAGRASANTAFNLGFLIGMIPAAIFVVLAFVGIGWIAAFLTGILMVLALMSFSNLVAYIAKSRAIERTYQHEVSTEIKNYCNNNQLSEPDFKIVANEILPESAALLRYIDEAPEAQPTIGENPDQSEV